MAFETTWGGARSNWCLAKYEQSRRDNYNDSHDFGVLRRALPGLQMNNTDIEIYENAEPTPLKRIPNLKPKPLMGSRLGIIFRGFGLRV